MLVCVLQFLNSPDSSSTPTHQDSLHSSSSTVDVKYSIRYVNSSSYLQKYIVFINYLQYVTVFFIKEL